MFQYSLAGRDGSAFGSWKTVLAVPVPLSVSGKTVPTVPVSGSGSVPEPPRKNKGTTCTTHVATKTRKDNHIVTIGMNAMENIRTQLKGLMFPKRCPHRILKPTKMVKVTSKIGVFLLRKTMQVGVECYVRSLVSVLWPHQLLAALWEFHPGAFRHYVLGGAAHHINEFWKVMPPRPGMAHRRDWRTKCVPIALHGGWGGNHKHPQSRIKDHRCH